MPLGQIEGKIKVHKTQDVSPQTVRMKRAAFAQELDRQGKQEAEERRNPDGEDGQDLAAGDNTQPEAGPQAQNSTIDVRV